jgi:hypothetical protein
MDDALVNLQRWKEHRDEVDKEYEELQESQTKNKFIFENSYENIDSSHIHRADDKTVSHASL